MCLVTSLKETEIYGLEKKLEAQANNLRLQFNEELNKHRNESDEEKMKLIISHDQQIVELQQTNKLEVSQMQKSTTEKQIELTQRILVLENERDLLKSERDELKEENQRLIEDKKLQVIILQLNEYWFSLCINDFLYSLFLSIEHKSRLSKVIGRSRIVEDRTRIEEFWNARPP